MSEIIQWNVTETPWPIDDQSVHCVVTSPPYWMLRNYQVEGQIGMEPTPAAYVETMVAVFRECWRVLRDDGVFWLNVGDSYAGSGGAGGDYNEGGLREGQPKAFRPGSGRADGKVDERSQRNRNGIGAASGVRPKSLCLIPERLAIALQDAGWIIRSRIAWCKKSSMPESVRDRPTSAWEHIWMFTKQGKYFYDAEAVKAKAAFPDGPNGAIRSPYGQGFTRRSGNKERKPSNQPDNGGPATSVPWEGSTANLRNFWLLGPEPFPEAHFATFPTEVPRRCIRASTSSVGCCSECGSPWERVVEREFSGEYNEAEAQMQRVRNAASGGVDRVTLGRTDHVSKQTTGWRPTCDCNAEVVPCTVLDPFMGSGTTACVAIELDRRWVGLELNPEYIEIAKRRIEKVGAPQIRMPV